MTEQQMVDGKRLGRQPYRHDPRTLRLARYLDTTRLPIPPPDTRYDASVPTWPMYGNDRIGDCVAAEVGHHIQAWTATASREVTVPDADVLGLYEKVSGYNPTTGANDNGAVILDVLNRWRKDGVAGHRIGAFAEVDRRQHLLVKTALWLFGGLSLGLALPIAAQSMGTAWRLPRGGTRTANGRPGSWGGHCVYAVAYSTHGLTVVTWGELTTMTWGFLDAYCEEVWAGISTDWLTGGRSIQGFDTQQLAADLANLGKVQ